MARIDFEVALGTLEENADLIREYWRDLRSNWQATEASLRRTVFYLGVLAIVFMLVVTHRLDEVTFLGLKVKDLSLVELLVPPSVGYLTWVACATAALAVKLQIVHDDFAEHYWPGLYSQGLQLYVRPVGGVADSAAITADVSSKLLVNAMVVAGATRLFALLIVPIAFEVYAIVQVIVGHPGHVVARAICVGLSCLFLLACLPSLIHVPALITGYGELSPVEDATGT